MEQSIGLLKCLEDYSKSDVYPFHMPGHKRQSGTGMGIEFPNPFEIDITEIDGFDSLHHPEGILKGSMEWAASVYGADKTYYLVNGSSCGILSAICGTTKCGGKILMGRNCHKSAYHGVILNHLDVEYVYPQIIPEIGIQGGLLVSDIETMLKSGNDIQAVLIVSPTYDGIVSDIKAISMVVHGYGIPLIVDEAHGAHFRYGDGFPQSALECGADVVVQSLHKTLPSLTQTALLHIKNGYVDVKRVERYLHIYQSTSPSYVFMASMDNCIRIMEADNGQRMGRFESGLNEMRFRLGSMVCLKLVDCGFIGEYGVHDMDVSKVVVSTRGTRLNGVGLERILRDIYHLEMEMCGLDYVTAITSVADSEEGMVRLEKALLTIDYELGQGDGNDTDIYREYLCKQKSGVDLVLNRGGGCMRDQLKHPNIQMKLTDAIDADTISISLEFSEGRISAEFIYIYPPGIPMIAPGEILDGEILKVIIECRNVGLAVQGSVDQSVHTIRVICE